MPPVDSGVDTVLYDFGGVFTASPFGALAQASTALGLDVTLVQGVLFGPYHVDGDHPWHRLERGEISLADCRASVLELAAEQGLAEDPFTFLAALGQEDVQREEVVRRALAIRTAGIRSALVTNNVAEFGDGWRRMVPVDELFDVVVDSSQAGMRKPNPAIFHAALGALGAAPRQAVFLDDFPANIAAAEALGIRGVLVGEDRLAAFDELDALLGLAPA